MALRNLNFANLNMCTFYDKDNVNLYLALKYHNSDNYDA